MTKSTKRSEEGDKTDVTRWLPKWTFDERKQKAIAFVGAGVVALATALWTVAHTSSEKPKDQLAQTNTNSTTVSPTINPQMNQNVTVSPPKAPSVMLKTSFDVCQGERADYPNKECYAPAAKHVSCDADVAEYIKTQCERFAFKQTHSASGGGCGYSVFHVECTTIKE
jgi:hypothetical protein